MTTRIATSTSHAERVALRRQLRSARRAIPGAERLRAAQRVATHLRRAGVLSPRTRLGVYLALPEELSLHLAMQHARQQHCELFVPHITHTRLRRMAFVSLAPSASLNTHRWGMAQLTRPGMPIDARTLDVVLLPLVGFDAKGHRVGMGGGFYDRLLARRTHAHSLRRPRLIGVAFDAQEVAALVPAAHDVRMDAVVTPRGLRVISRA